MGQGMLGTPAGDICPASLCAQPLKGHPWGRAGLLPQPGGSGSSEPLPTAGGTAGTGVHGSHGGVRAEAGGGHLLGSGMSMSPLPTGPGAGRGPVLTLGTGGGTQELLAGFSLLGELEEEDDDDDEKFTGVMTGGLVAVFCPVRLLRQTGQLSCCSSQGTMQPSWKRWLQGSCRTRSPSS